MKQLFIISLISLGFSAQAYAQYFPVDTGELNSAYRELQKNPASRERQVAFFNAFPSTWMEYTMTYQYMPGFGYDKAMYNLNYSHLHAFTEMLGKIPDSTYCHKLIQLCTGGSYGADAPAFLQVAARQHALKKLEVVFAQLSKLKRGEQLRFWMFCWHTMLKKGDAPKEMAQIKAKMNALYPKEVKIMELGFEYSWGEAHHPPLEEYPHLYKKQELQNMERREQIQKSLSTLSPVVSNRSEVFLAAEEMPQFPGGDKGLREFLGANVRYPAVSMKNNVRGRVLIRFVVNTEGNIEQAEVVQGLDESCNREALRVINSMPKWTPGRIGGKPVSVYYTVPFSFR
jgi:TonB family protein